MTNENEHFIQLLPTEILIYIFTLLKPKQLAKCRQICIKWKHVIDSLSLNQIFWKQQCKLDFNNDYISAYYKRVPGLSWCNIYRSLTLWSKLEEAVETRDEFASASSIWDEIRDFKVLKNGIIGVQTRNSIKYFDILTLKLSTRTLISDNYLRYAENDEALVILGSNLNLLVVKKVINNQSKTFDNVKSFNLINNSLYYITLNDEVYFCDLNNEELRGVYLNQASSSIMSIGFSNNKIHILTFQRDIYSIVEKKLVFHFNLDTTRNLLHELKKFNFLDNLDWRVFFQWMFALNHTVPQGPLRDIIIIKTYNEVVFVGSNYGVLRIYYAPYQANEFDIFHSEPIKQYNFMERSDCPVLSTCPIIQIDVLEGIDSHLVLVAMPKKIAVLNFTHTFVTAKSVALLPYEVAQSTRLLIID